MVSATVRPSLWTRTPRARDSRTGYDAAEPVRDVELLRAELAGEAGGDAGIEAPVDLLLR